MSISVPVDGRFQFSFATAAVANASLGRMPWDGIEQVGPDAYVVRGSWPTPKPTPTNSFSSAVAASTSVPAPKSSAAALAKEKVWVENYVHHLPGLRAVDLVKGVAYHAVTYHAEG
jgi:hypothetical protein